MSTHRTPRHGNGASHSSHDKGHMSEIGDNLREIGEHGQGVAQDNYEQIKDRAAKYYETGREKAEEWEEQVVRYVKNKPIQSMLIAAGVGMLLGRYWSRR